jgi:uncharacterized protein YeaO (DUF488 family)
VLFEHLMFEWEWKMIKLKRIYEEPSTDDGFRVLVERLWPRGMSKERAHIDLWLKDIAPSTELRKWYHHNLTQWDEFQKHYWEELKSKEDLVNMLREKRRQGMVTFVFATRDIEHSGALALKKFIEHVPAKTR